MITFAQLLSPLTQDQVRSTMVFALQRLGIDPTKWKSGGTMSTVLTAVAGTIASFTTVLTQGIGSGFLPTAVGGWLRLLAQYVYGIDPSVLQATFATGQVNLVNGGGLTFSFSPGQVIFQDPLSKNTYSNTDAISLGPNATQNGVGVICQTAGSAGSVPPGAITAFVTTMIGVSVTNPEAVVGLDAPDDPTVRQLCLDKLGAMSVRGPRTAYAYAIQVATNASSGAPVNINRWWISPSAHTGVVTVNVASPSGTPIDDDVAGVENSIESIARPNCVTVNVHAAGAIPYDAELVVYCATRVGLAASDVLAAVQAGLITFFATYPIGGLAKGGTSGVWGSGVEGVCKSADPGIFAVDGAFDLTLGTRQVAANATTVTVVMVTPLGNVAA